MRAVVQRVTEASVTVGDEVVGAIGPGLMVLLGIRSGDTPLQAEKLAEKVANLRIFGDDAGKMNRSVLEVSGQVLVVSQFTLYGDTRHGRRPSFIEAALPEEAEPLINQFIDTLRSKGLPTATGRFQAMMLVRIANDGPVTIILDA